VRTTIVRVPLAPGLKLARLKRIRVGWATCRVKELVAKQDCARCFEYGHATVACTGKESRRCFRCKKIGHLIASCDLPSTEKQAQTHLTQRTAAPGNVPPTSTINMPVNDAKSSLIKVLQVNLNHCRTAQQLLSQTMEERRVDVAHISDYLRPSGEQHWISSTDNKCLNKSLAQI